MELLPRLQPWQGLEGVLQVTVSPPRRLLQASVPEMASAKPQAPVPVA